MADKDMQKIPEMAFPGVVLSTNRYTLSCAICASQANISWPRGTRFYSDPSCASIKKGALTDRSKHSPVTKTV